MRTKQELVDAYGDIFLEVWYMWHCTCVRDVSYWDQTPDQIRRIMSIAERIEKLFGADVVDICKRDDTKNEWWLNGAQDALRWALGGDWHFLSSEEEETKYVLRLLEAREKKSGGFKPVRHEWLCPFSAAAERAPEGP